MRKISFEASQALMSHQKYNGVNTKVVADPDASFLELHSNTIARLDVKTGVLEITTSGWDTSTTKERLNALPDVHIVQKAGVWYLNGKIWDGCWITIK